MVYAKTGLPSPITVHTLVTVFHVEMAKQGLHGESHEFPEMLYVDKGTHLVLLDGELFTLSAGQMLIYAPYTYHIGAAHSEAVADIVSFETDFAGLDALCNRVITLSDEERRLYSQIITLGCGLFRRSPAESGLHGMIPREGIDPFDLMRLKNLLELLLIELYTHTETKNAPPSASNGANFRHAQLRAVTEYLKNRLHCTLTLEEIARDCSMSTSKLKKLFRDEFGCGPIAYFTALKMGEAKKLICGSAMNMTEIAQRLGFSSVHYFSRQFKEKNGISPSEYAGSVYKKQIKPNIPAE